jgi:hypothetical protein
MAVTHFNHTAADFAVDPVLTFGGAEVHPLFHFLRRHRKIGSNRTQRRRTTAIPDEVRHPFPVLVIIMMLLMSVGGAVNIDPLFDDWECMH